MVESDAEYLVKKDETLFHISYEWEFWLLSASYDAFTKRKKYMLWIKSISKQKLSENYPHVISFHPLAMNLMYLSPSHRRDYLDEILIKAIPEYREIILGYKKVLKHRNTLLKNISLWKSQISELEFWNKKYISGNLAIYKYRKILLEFLEENIHSLEKYFFWKVQNISFQYKSKIYDTNIQEIENSLIQYINNEQQKEILLGKSLRGIHLDDFDILVDDIPLIHFASRGEVKSCLLGFIFLLTDFLEKNSIKKQVLFLLDDILSELDSIHRDLLWEYIWEKQCIITSIEDCLDDANKIYL